MIPPKGWKDVLQELHEGGQEWRP